MRVAGKTVLLTGATGGIGAALALALAREGAQMILVARDAEALEALRGALPVRGKAHVAVAADLLDVNDRLRVRDVCAVEELSLLINNAGVSTLSFLADSAMETIERQLALNLNVPILLTRLLLPQLLSRADSAIVNIGSAFGSIGYPGFSVYCASKFGLRGFSESLRRELADTNVRVLHFAPRATRTALNSEKVVAMNHALGNACDDPADVAIQIVDRIAGNRWGFALPAWPERLYALINAVFPALTDGTLRKQLPVIRRFAQPSLSSTQLNPTGEKP